MLTIIMMMIAISFCWSSPRSLKLWAGHIRQRTDQ